MSESAEFVRVQVEKLIPIVNESGIVHAMGIKKAEIAYFKFNNKTREAKLTSTTQFFSLLLQTMMFCCTLHFLAGFYLLIAFLFFRHVSRSFWHTCDSVLTVRFFCFSKCISMYRYVQQRTRFARSAWVIKI